jgi:hypothetical protein
MSRSKQVGLLASLAICGMPWAAVAADLAQEIQLKVREVSWADENTAWPSKTNPQPTSTTYRQHALGLELNYKSPWWADIFGVDASVYGVLKLADSGTPTTQLVEVGDDGQLQDGFATFGQAFLKARWNDLALVKVGRQFQDSMLLKSTTNRAVPDTYSGVDVLVTPAEGVKVYGMLYNRYRSRTTDEFVSFRTEASGANAIKYVGILGASYSDKSFDITAEWLLSKSYLSKFGVLAAWSQPMSGSTLKLSAGAFASRDAGSLFVCGAEKEMDCAGTGRITNNGNGVFVDADWKVGDLTLGATLSQFGGLWIEDNFAVNAQKTGALTQDPGTNPFPTSSTIGPDFTNNDETAAAVRMAYDWRQVAPGLKMAFKYVHGTGAHSSNLSTGAEGRESYRELDLRYAVPAVAGLGLRYQYLNYDSHISGFVPGTATINGLTRQVWGQHRFYVEYSRSF